MEAITNNLNITSYRPTAKGGQGDLVDSPDVAASQEQDYVVLAGKIQGNGHQKDGILNYLWNLFSPGGSAEASTPPPHQPTEQEVYDEWRVLRESSIPPILRTAETRFTQNRLVIESEVRRDGSMLQYARSYLETQLQAGETALVRSIVLSAVRQNGLALGDAPTQFRHDPEVVRTAVGQNGLVLSLFPEDSPERANPDLALAAVRENPEAIQYVAHSLFSNEAFFRACLATNNFYIINCVCQALIDPEATGSANQQMFYSLAGQAGRQTMSRYLRLVDTLSRLRLGRHDSPIRFYERFPRATLEQVQELAANRSAPRPNDHRPVALVVMSESDDAGSFIDSHILELMEPGYRVVYYEVASREEFYQTIEETGNRRPIDLFYFAGHGSQVRGQTRVRFGDNRRSERSYLSTRDGQEMRARNLARYLSPNAVILSQSCHTGEEPESLLPTLRYVFPGHSVYAPAGSPLDFQIEYQGSAETHDLSIGNIRFTLEQHPSQGARRRR